VPAPRRPGLGRCRAGVRTPARVRPDPPPLSPIDGWAGGATPTCSSCPARLHPGSRARRPQPGSACTR
jgi:hypothetical protein